MRTFHIRFLPLVGFAVASLLLSDCGKKTTATLKVASMKTKGASRAESSATRGPSSLVASSTAYSFATVDGIKVSLTKIRGLDAASDNPLVDQALAKDLTFTGDSSQQVALSQAITWAPGSFRGISLYLKNSWQVKSYCKTQKNNGTGGYLVYTSASGVKRVNCGTGDCSTLPTDYDYTSYSFLSTYSGYTSSGIYNQDTHYNFTVKTGDSPIVSVLFDGSFNVACWDGGTWSDTDAINGFNGSANDTVRQSFWPNGTPAMATSYLPIFAYLTNDASEAIPTARTFITSTSAATDVDTSLSAFTYKNTPVVTLAYKSDGSILAGSTRNYQGTSGAFDLDLEGFTASSTGTGSDFFSSGWYYQGGSAAPTFVRNRQIIGLNAPATAGTTFSTTVKDGSGCGQTLSDFQSNNPSRACLGSGVTQTMYWREMNRN